MEELKIETCAYPGCERPVTPAPEGGGRPSSYCEVPGHNAQTAFRERRRRGTAGDNEDDVDRAGGDRPVSLAGATLRAVAVRLATDLERTREALGILTDSEQLEAELAAVRADTQAEISHAAQHEAIARRERMQADAAAEAALTTAEQAQAREQAAAEREHAAETRASEAELRADEAQRLAQDAIARSETAAAAQAAAEASAAQAAARAEQAEHAAADALEAR
ncbi:MAG: hypothetical protein ACLP50_36755, partial [Solirubrobacteraceae bacterium]